MIQTTGKTTIIFNQKPIAKIKINTGMKRIFSILVFAGLCYVAQGQYTFECYGGYLSGADCQICTGQTTARLFNGLIIRQGANVFRLIDCPYFIRQQGNNLIITELIPNPESVTINLLSSGFSTVTGFRDSIACMCARQDSSWIGGGGGSTYYQTWKDDGTALTQQPNANFLQSDDINISLTNDGGNTETEVSADILTNAVNYAEIQQVAANRILGNPTGSTANVAEIPLATGLFFSGGNLNVADRDSLNEAWTIDADDSDLEVISSQIVKFQGGGINVTDYVPATNTLIITGTEVDGSTTNELQTIANTSDATSHTATLSNSGGSVQIIEGTGIGLSTGGTGLDGTVTVTNTAPDQTVSITGAGINVVTGTYPNFTITGTEVDGSTTNEAWAVDADAGATEVISNQTVLFSGGGINTTSYDAGTNTVTITGTEADGSVSNEGILGVTAGGSNDANLTTNTSLGNAVNFAGGGIVNVTETTSVNGGAINITATEVDGSVTNEAWTVDADGGDTEVISNQTLLVAGGGIVSTSYSAAGNTLTVTGTEVDGNTSNEGVLGVGAGGANTAVINSNTSGATGVTVSGAGILAVTESTSANGGTITLTATEVDGSTSNELQTLSNTSDASSHTATLSNSGGSIKLIEGSNITLTTGGTGLDGTVTIAATGGAANYQTVRDDGVDETQRAALNFVSTSTVNAVGTDDAGNNETEIALNVPTDGITATEIAAGAVGTSEIATNAVANDDIRQSAALSVVGNPTNATANVQDISAASDFEVLRRSGTSIGFGSINLASSNAVTGTLPVANGGTGATTFTNDRLLTGNGTSALVAEANATFSGSTLTITGNQIIGITTPTATQHALRFSNSVVSATNNVAQYGGRSLINLTNDGTPTGNSLTHWYAESTTTNPTKLSAISGFNCFLANTSPNVTSAYGMYGRLDEGSSTAVSNRYGLRFDLNRTTNNTDTHTGYGIQTNIADNSTSGRWTQATGVSVAVTNALTAYGGAISVLNNRGTANTQIGLSISNTTSGASVTTTNAYGISLSQSAASGGAITNYYGLYTASTPPATNNYLLYASGSGWRSYLNSSLSLGVDDAANGRLVVRGAGATSGTNTALFENSSGTDILTVRDDARVGVNTASPNRAFEVAGEVRITDLVTDTPTRIIGADADGDLDTVGIGAEAELHLTNGTLGTNFHTTISPTSITANQTDYNPSGLATAWVVRLSADDGFRIIRSLVAPSYNKRITFHNAGSNSILFANQCAFSGVTASYRFDFGRDIILFPGKSIEIMYDVTSSRWRLLSKAGIYDDVEHLYFNERLNAPVSGSSGDYYFWDFVSENGIGGVAPVAGRLSGISVNTGSSATGIGYVASKDVFFENTNAAGTANWAYCKAVVKTPSRLSNGTDDYTIRIGFAAGTAGGGANDGFYFDYNHANVSGNWGCNTTNAGNTQRNNSGIAVTASTNYLLEVFFRPDLTAEYYINGTRVATNDTFVPAGTSDDLLVMAEIQKNASTEQRTLTVYTLQTSIAFVK